MGGPPLFTLLQPEMPTDGVRTDRCDQPLTVAASCCIASWHLHLRGILCFGFRLGWVGLLSFACRWLASRSCWAPAAAWLGWEPRSRYPRGRATLLCLVDAMAAGPASPEVHRSGSSDEERADRERKNERIMGKRKKKKKKDREGQGEGDRPPPCLLPSSNNHPLNWNTLRVSLSV